MLTIQTYYCISTRKVDVAFSRVNRRSKCCPFMPIHTHIHLPQCLMDQFDNLSCATDSDFTTINLADAYDALEPSTHFPSQPLERIFLQWAPEQQVVVLPTHTWYTLLGKRLVDILISGLVITCILSWLIPIVGAVIMLESSGPVLFFQARSGRKGRPFWCIKFRTMQHETNSGGNFRQTSQQDERVTPFGRFLRRTNIDEMPQFFNVFISQMSVVGPRPHALLHDAMHWKSSAYRERYWVRPGITGLAQVRGSRGATGMTQRMAHRVRYDHLYIPRQTLGLDLKICWRTVKLMVAGDRNAW